ncbi:MAG: chemoreceptor glutamine deamidase CheD [bacterium]|nr:chemoreceptor glutamine deamidase CheD [bacterium]
MKEIYLEKFKRNVKILGAGDYYATDKSEGIATVMGACIATCIYEDGGRIGGMKHFLIPGDFRDDEIFLSPIARFGMYAMELLMGELIKLKVERSKLRAKVFGGSGILEGGSAGIGANNIKFIKTYLRMEGIPLAGINVGGNIARKIIFFPDTGKVMMKKINANLNKIVGTENRYKQKIEMEI